MRSRSFIIAFLSISVLGFAGCSTMGAPGLRSDVTFPYMETGNEWNKRYGDEPYVFLLSDDIVEVKEDFSYTEDVHLVIKIQKEEGKKIGEFPLPYDSSRENIEDIQAYVLTPDDRKLRYSSIQEHAVQQGFAVYSDNKVKTITFPNVLIGSMIDIRFRLHHLIPKVEKEFFETFYITGTFPIKYSRMVLTVPRNMPLTIKYGNTSIEPETRYSDRTVRYTWEAAYRDKVINEEFMPHYSEISEKVSFSTVADWKRLSKYGWSLFEKNLKPSPELKEAVREIRSRVKDRKEQVQAVLEYIQENFRYVSLNIDYHNYEPHPSGQVFYNKYGDCKDQTILAMAMLDELGIKAYPALLSTHSDLTLREDLTPMLDYFDHVILGIEFGNKINYTDVLLKGHKFWETPSAWSGTNVLLLKPDGDTFHQVPIADERVVTTYVSQKISLNDDASATGVLSATLDRLATTGIRDLLKGLTDSDNKRWLSMFATKLVPGGTITENKVVNLDETYMNLEFLIQYQQNNWAESIDDMLVFGVGAADRGPSFSAETRHNPIEFRRGNSVVIENEYVIPEGYEIVTLPDDLSIETDFAYYKRYYRAEGQKILEKVSSGTKRAYLPADRYQEVKKYYDDLVPLTKKRIAIRKKS